jgi:hypothetical protein
VGSAKIKGTSASEVMARALLERLERAGVKADLHFATEFVHEDLRAAGRAQSIAAADLFLLVTPLYVDAFPALATHALELVASARRGAPPPPHPKLRPRFAVLVNCGFPEAEQNRTALRIARHFAAEAGYAWAGGLPLGGGGVVTPDRPFEPHGPIAHIVRAIDLAAPALTAGSAVPREAILSMAEAPLPDGVYRLMGNLGWIWLGYRNGLGLRDLGARPLDPPA